MLIDEILSKFDFSGPRGFYSFETFVLNLLSFHIEEQGKKFETTSQRSGFGDALAPNGFDSYEGKTLIEIKNDLNRFPSRMLHERILRAPLGLKNTKKIENLIIVTARQTLPRTIEKIKGFQSDPDIDFNISFIGPEELNKIVSKHRKKANQISNNLFSLRLESTISKEPKDWKKERENKLEKLKYEYSKGQFSLFLGAGVSSSAGMPDWNKLLNSLFVNFLAKEFNSDTNISETDISEIVDRLNSIDEPTSLMAARYIRKGFSKDATESKEFHKAITKSLYKLRDTKAPIESPLIKAIGSLCTPKMTGSKVKSVITYNFDDLIEREFNRRSIDSHSIYSEQGTFSNDELPVFHVHGFLPEATKGYEGLDQSTLVFSEEGYHQIYLESYHWSNLVQLNNLKNNVCIMIGLSMSDPNLRRLLEISSRNTERTQHFAFIKRISDNKFCYKKSQKINRDVKAIKNTKGALKFLQTHHSLNEEIMKELGVSIIWYEDHDELPGLLSKIKE
jgi:hypothetical protein